MDSFTKIALKNNSYKVPNYASVRMKIHKNGVFSMPYFWNHIKKRHNVITAKGEQYTWK